MSLLLAASLSTSSYVLAGPAMAPTRATVVMNEAAAKAAWLAKQDSQSWGPPAGAARPAASSLATRDPAPLAAPSGQPINKYGQPAIAGRSVSDVYKAQEKARKSYVGKEVQVCGERYGKGWTTH